jgi:hypothetical protein
LHLRRLPPTAKSLSAVGLGIDQAGAIGQEQKIFQSTICGSHASRGGRRPPKHFQEPIRHGRIARASRMLKTAIVVLFNRASLEAKLQAARKITTHVANPEIASRRSRSRLTKSTGCFAFKRSSVPEFFDGA